MVEIRLCGGVEVARDGRVLPESLLAGRQGRLVLAYLVCERHRAVPREELAELLWPVQLPSSWTASLSAVISRLRKLLTEAGLDGATALATVLPAAYRIDLPTDAVVDWEIALAAIAAAEDAIAEGDGPGALASAEQAASIAARGFFADDCAWVDAQRDALRDVAVRAALARSDAFVVTGSAARAVDAARDALVLDERREAAFRALMRAHAAAGERAEALRVWERCRATLVDELGVDPSPETEAVYLAILGGATAPGPSAPVSTTALPSGVVTFLLTDIVDSSTMWDRHPAAMAAALERHDALVADVVARAGGMLLKSKLEGDATVSVFTRATAGAAAALALRDALKAQEWPDNAEPHVRMALHTGEAFERAGDYFGPALNRAARLRALARADQILLSQAAAELVRDPLPAGAALVDRGHHDLRGLSRGENVFELLAERDAATEGADAAVARALPAALRAAGPFVGRVDELALLTKDWERVVGGATLGVFIGGEPGVGKSRLAAEYARNAHRDGAFVLYGRCDEDLDAPYQPFIDALPELADLMADSSATRADPDTVRHALFTAVTRRLAAAAVDVPVVLVIDDLHWAGKTTLALLRHVLRTGGDARLMIIGTYRDTELSRTHPLAATLADLRAEGAAQRLRLEGLAVADVLRYTAESGFDDGDLASELAKITAGNPFFLIETLRHIRESGGTWRPESLPEGVKEATGRRLARLSEPASAALSIAAVVGSTFALDIVEAVQDADLVDEIAEACRAGIVVEDPARPGRFAFAHAIVRQVLLAELVTVRRIRLHRAIAELLEARAGDTDAYLVELAHHWFECASSGAADRAVDACRRAAEDARDGLAYEEASDLYAMALTAIDWSDDPQGETAAALHIARCDALLTAGEVVAARGAVDALGRLRSQSPRLAAWHATYACELAVRAEPERLGEIVDQVGAAAETMRTVGDVAGEAKAHYVHALALSRLGRIGESERALDIALAAARRADEPRLADAILAEVPLAVLWGPSPVTRASGRCLDVVRVCRITEGASAVESVAVRSQAVLEGLRGRFDAARRMLVSAQRTADQLGLPYHRLETAAAAATVELIAHDWEAAERIARPAWDELRERRLGGEASRVGGMLARALLMQRRIEEADAVITEAAGLAGEDVRAGVVWRGVAGEIAARRGDHEYAIALAREAVAMAASTDALLSLANARLSFAAVLYAAGRREEAEAEMREAIAVCDAKGAVALADAAREVDAQRNPGPVPQLALTSVYANSAVRLTGLAAIAATEGDEEAVLDYFVPGMILDDRRRLIGLEQVGEPMVALAAATAAEVGFEVLATRGDLLMLSRVNWDVKGSEVEFLNLTTCDETPRIAHATWFDPEDVDAALVELDLAYAAGEGAAHAEIVGRMIVFIGAVNRGEWSVARTYLSDDYRLVDRRAVGLGQMDVDGLGGNFDALRKAGLRRHMRVEHLPAISDRALVMVSVEIGEVERDGGGFEHRQINLLLHDGHSICGQEIFAEDDLDLALARFEELSVDAPKVTD